MNNQSQRNNQTRNSGFMRAPRRVTGIEDVYARPVANAKPKKDFIIFKGKYIDMNMFMNVLKTCPRVQIANQSALWHDDPTTIVNTMHYPQAKESATVAVCKYNGKYIVLCGHDKFLEESKKEFTSAVFVSNVSLKKAVVFEEA